MKANKYILACAMFAAGIVPAARSAPDQQITGTPGSPSATTTIDGKQLPPPDPKFGGVIKDTAADSKPYWPPSVVPPLVLALMTSYLSAAARNFPASKLGYASLRLSPKPSDKLSPKTKTVFIVKGPRAAPVVHCANKSANVATKNAALRHCFTRLPILFSGPQSCCWT
jgi:hypothetical protein